MAVSFPVPAGSVILVPGGPDNSLPQPPPGYWGGVAPPVIDNTLPPPPPGIWPPPVGIWPPTPLPPDYPMPPGSIWPSPGHPAHPIAPGGPPPHPDQGLPGDQPLPGHDLPSQKFLVAIVAVSAGVQKVVGYTVVDPSLSVWGGAPSYPDQSLPPTEAQPRR
jgi:hypothetical protein